MFLFIIAIALIALLADTWHLYRHQWRLGPTVVWIAATDLLPFVLAAIGYFSHDNTAPVMQVSMWLLWGWFITVPPRMIYYLFRYIRLPRTGVCIALASVVFILWGTTIGRTSVRVSNVEVCSSRLPESFNGLRIVQISDLHLGTLVSPKGELTRLANHINALHPDLVIFTGDLINIRPSELDAQNCRLLQRIAAPVYSVTGNHDIGTYIKDSLRYPIAASAQEILLRQRAMGWHVLQDTTVYLHRNGDSISLTGISFDPALRELRHNRDLPANTLIRAYHGIPTTTFNITAVHLPQLWAKIKATPYGDLTLSGHVHAMQLKFRPWGRGWSPAAWLYDQWSGRYDDKFKTLYINDGVGYVAYPMRLGVRPEVTLITLKTCE